MENYRNKHYKYESDYIKDVSNKYHKKLVNKWISIIRKKIVKAVRNGYDRVYTFLPGSVASEVAQYFKNEKFLVEIKPYMDNLEYSFKLKWE